LPGEILEEVLATKAFRDALGLDQHLPHSLYVLGQYLDRDANLARAPPRVTILADVLLGQRVDVRLGALLRQLGPAAHLDVPVRVVWILRRQRHVRMALEILVLHASSRCVEPDVLPVEVRPHRRDLRGSPGVDGGDVGKGSLLEDVAVLRERSIRRHDRPPLSWPQAENAVSEHLSTFIGDVSPRPCSRSLSAFRPRRSEEHTSELQSRFDLVCRLLLEKKKKKQTQNTQQ